METIDTLIIGGGVVGLSLARALAGRSQIVLLEQEARPGLHLSSHNSEVIHAGLYYPPGSLKARLCVRGNALLNDYARQHQLPHRICGKLIVASDGQLTDLEALHDNARRSGVHDLRYRDAAWLHRHEPWLDAHHALWSPGTGIIDSQALIQRLATEAEQQGALLGYRHRVMSLQCQHERFQLQVASDQGEFSLHCRHLINAAGLAALPLLQTCSGFPTHTLPEQRHARGNYFTLQGPSPTQRLIYPLPETHGLGVHLTVDLAGQGRFGPDVEWLTEVNTQQPDYRVNGQRHGHFIEAILRYWPKLDYRRLTPAYAGIRPKLFVDGQPYQDFLIQGPEQHGVAGLINLLGIESPGLTAALAIAEKIASDYAW